MVKAFPRPASVGLSFTAKTIITVLAIGLTCAGLSGCKVDKIDATITQGTKPGAYTAQFKIDGTPRMCSVTPADSSNNNYDCTYSLSGAGQFDHLTLVITNAGPSPAGNLSYFHDPLIAQVPTSATVVGTYDDGQGTSGPLAITTGLSSIPIDANTNLVAEAGTQLVIIDFPTPFPPNNRNYHFVVTVDGSAPAYKAMFTGKVLAGGNMFYPPILPCVTSFSSIPYMSFNNAGGFPAPWSVAEYLAQIQGCKGKVYTFPSGGPPATVDVVEFYNASLDHYFITWVAAEIDILDAGTVIKGWKRTGYSFKAYAVAGTGTSPICRFYIPPGLGDSHFFGRGRMECDDTARKFPSFDLEDPMFMQMFLPSAGTCPANTTEVYRVFSNRADANHRYMTDKTVRAVMVAKGWLAEGDGPNLVVMCAPQ